MEKYSKKQTPKLPKELIDLRAKYKEQGIPSALLETLNQLTLFVSVKSPKTILEIGTATGISGISMLLFASGAKLYTIEKDEWSYNEAKNNFICFGFEDGVKQYLGDAGDILNYLEGSFDFVFLDGAKGHYNEYLFDIKRLLSDGGVLFADNVLFRGYVDGGVPYGRGDNTIVNNMRRFLDDVLSDKDFVSSVYEIGDGLLIAQKI